MADGYALFPRVFPQRPVQTMYSVSRRDASLKVQHPLRNEHGDDLAQSISTFFLHAQKRPAGVELRC